MSRFQYEWEATPQQALTPDTQEVILAQVQCVINERTRRYDYLRSDLFSDPAWDLLLQLYASELSQQRTSVSQLAERINVPSTTTLRWIKLLECDDLLGRKIDPLDSRRVFLALTHKGLTAMTGYFLGKN
jgi:DNA-binding MarR family transcriptional regulator